MDVRAVAFYLPQFHPIPENDEWWGRGFTEWHNVTRAAPLFRGHYQPHLPADLGFYDLRLAETRELQAQLARAHGIHGFCYWHYWFEGRRLLQRPFDDVLVSGKPELPFCLAWANESWSRRWLGEEMAVLAEQTYSASDDLGHARWLLSALADARAIRVHGRPLFLIYRPRHLPDPRRTTDVIRHECVRAGLPDPYLVGIDAHCPGTDCREIGFDGTLRFEPQLGLLPLALDDGPSWARLRRNLGAGVPSRELKIYDYVEARRLMNARRLEHPYFPTVFVGWDNTPRRGRAGVIVTGNTPERFGRALEEAVETVTSRAPDEHLIFVNAWNEWAEGNHLEPDQKTGLAYLERLRETFAYAGRSTSPSASASSALR
jgi:lipopolysaccharide biosynthesis protein